VPLQLLPPPEQSRVQVAALSQTRPLQVPLRLQTKSQLASWLHCTPEQDLPPPPQSIWQLVPSLHSAPLQAVALQSLPSKQLAEPLLQPLHTVVSQRH
jgi:hypothetical protein